ncbi:hypothetical protein COLO4_11423 [Corchorus olitorius]|uniref:RRM domain-containing protein n=1 Tax=Corchorus olitorius TaxID=93759 RepID=A0A1R3K4I0_9ROSI|nr:hypothetical protein COLO4_11423 [Corchorus olitorius]
MVLGIPWDVDTDGLREYMSKYGDIEDCVVLKERSTGRSRGFGYVTFESSEDAKNVLLHDHYLGDRLLEVKIATPKEEMNQMKQIRAPSSVPVRVPVPAQAPPPPPVPLIPKKVSRIFVARIPLTVDEEAFRSHFEEYGEITDLYMPKDQDTRSHRGIGFITFARSDSVDNVMSEDHEFDGARVIVDRATPREEELRQISRMAHGGYGAYNAYISAATRYAALGAPTMYDLPGPVYGRGDSSQEIGKKIFVGKLPQKATAEDLSRYFSRFGEIVDVYVPKDPKRTGHRGFGFVTFADDGVAVRVYDMKHEICGQQVAIDSATPVIDARPNLMSPVSAFGVVGGGPMRPFSRMYGAVHFGDPLVIFASSSSRLVPLLHLHGGCFLHYLGLFRFFIITLWLFSSAASSSYRCGFIIIPLW